MNRPAKILGLVLIVALTICLNAFGDDFKEPTKPKTDKIFDQAKEKKLDRIASLPAEEAFGELTADDFLTNPDLSYKAIYKAFRNRKPEILDLAQLYLMLPLKEDAGGEAETLQKGFLVSKRIFETFPEEAAPVLRSLYVSGDAVTRGNTIRAAGKVSGGDQVKYLLTEALDDKSSFEELSPDDMGEPLRVCDMAYNELVLRYAVKAVHRTIGPGNPIEVRDQLIDMLKDMINNQGKAIGHE